jgi:membrane-associated phospholipid phosphatase
MLVLHFWLVWIGSFPGDMWALRRSWGPHSSLVDDYASVFSYLGTATAAVVILLVGSWALLSRGLLRELLGLVVAYLVVPLNAILKLVFGPSPLWAQFHHDSRNFPSGHVTFVTAVIGYLALVSWRAGNRWMTAVGVVLIVGIGPARVVTGVHLVSDVVAGYLVGASWLILAYTSSKPRTVGPGVEPSLRQEDR